MKIIPFNKELMWTFFDKLITLLGGLFLIKILAVTLSKETYGFYALITSVSALVIMLPFSALLQGVSRYISIYQQKLKYNKFFTVTLILFIVILFVYSILAMIFKSYIDVNSSWYNVFYIVFAFIVSEIIKILYRTINNANRQRKNLVISLFLEFSIKLIILYYLYYIYNFISISNLLTIFILSNIISIIIMQQMNKNIFDINTFKIKEAKVIVLRIFLFSAPLILWAVFGWLRDMSNRWYLDYFLDKEQVALFAMMSSIAMIAPTALSGLIGSYVMPILYQKENKIKGYTRNLLFKLLPKVLIVFIFSFIITYIFKNEIILIIADEKYLDISWMLPWMFLVFSIYSLSMMATYELFAHKQTKKLIFSSIAPGIISMICGYFFIKNYGIDGALYNYIITYLSYALLTFYVVFKYIKLNKLETLK
jgi:O-antigen/teichoic acid export membrane protein